ncbi:MAG: 2TM domain-containing protein [Leucobacter sp.]|jgi:energy-coupling factor transporter transmembrane protein EcfT|nr:2TM domain-containing protein [Leucobacter sp.]
MNEELRDEARKRIKAKRGFWNLILVFAIITVIVNVIWFLSGTGYYWPMWPMLGFIIAIFFTGLNTYGPGNRPISDAEIDREMRKLKGE